MAIYCDFLLQMPMYHNPFYVFIFHLQLNLGIENILYLTFKISVVWFWYLTVSTVILKNSCCSKFCVRNVHYSKLTEYWHARIFHIVNILLLYTVYAPYLNIICTFAMETCSYSNAAADFIGFVEHLMTVGVQVIQQQRIDAPLWRQLAANVGLLFNTWW